MFLSCYLFFDCSQWVSTLGHRQEEKVLWKKNNFFLESFLKELIFSKRNNKKYTGDITNICRMKLFSGPNIITDLIYIYNLYWRHLAYEFFFLLDLGEAHFKLAMTDWQIY